MGSFGEAMKHIGNAVPVRLALAVAEPIAEWAKEELQSNKNNRADTI